MLFGQVHNLCRVLRHRSRRRQPNRIALLTPLNDVQQHLSQLSQPVRLSNDVGVQRQPEHERLALATSAVLPWPSQDANSVQTRAERDKKGSTQQGRVESSGFLWVNVSERAMPIQLPNRTRCRRLLQQLVKCIDRVGRKVS